MMGVATAITSVKRSNWRVEQSCQGTTLPTEGAKMAEKKVIYRSSITGRIITKRNAEQHPKTTERQHVPVKNPKK
jgi:hypothetical protein